MKVQSSQIILKISPEDKEKIQSMGEELMIGMSNFIKLAVYEKIKRLEIAHGN